MLFEVRTTNTGGTNRETVLIVDGMEITGVTWWDQPGSPSGDSYILRAAAEQLGRALTDREAYELMMSEGAVELDPSVAAEDRDRMTITVAPADRAAIDRIKRIAGAKNNSDAISRALQDFSGRLG